MLTMVFAALGVFVGLERMMLQAQLTKMMQTRLKEVLLGLSKAQKVG